MAEEKSARPEFVFSTTLWNSLGVLEAILAFVTVYAAARWVARLKRRLEPWILTN